MGMTVHRHWVKHMHRSFTFLEDFSSYEPAMSSFLPYFSVFPRKLIHLSVRFSPILFFARVHLDGNPKFCSNPSFRRFLSASPSNSIHSMASLNPRRLSARTQINPSGKFCPIPSSGCFRAMIPCGFIHFTASLDPVNVLARSQMKTIGNFCLNPSLGRFASIALCSSYSTKAPTRSLRRRISKRKKSNAKPVLDEAKFQQMISQLPPRFTPEELANAINLQEDPLVCFHLFNWASQQPRFKHDICSYHTTVRKLGAAKMYKEMDDIVNHVLSVRHIGNENLYNSIVFYFTQAGKLIRAVNIFKHMRNSKNLDCRPTIRTYHILFKALLRRGNNSYINHVYMETVRSLFKQMVDDGIEPDVFALNCMIKGYVLSLHVNDALRIFHQMGVVYNCQPNSYSYDHLIHGLCAQGRTMNARELLDEMKTKGFVPSGKSYNSLVNAFALSGEVDLAAKYLWEMIRNGRLVDFITYRTLVDEFCRKGNDGEAMKLLKMLREKELVDGDMHKKLVAVLGD